MTEQDQPTDTGADDTQGHLRRDADADDTQGHACPRVVGDDDDDVKGHMRHS